MKPQKSVLITDLDNTLFDWFEIWYHPFRALLDELVTASGLREASLKEEVKIVHQRHGTSEYAFLIEELECLPLSVGYANRVEQYASAIKAFQEERRKHMSLYPGVMKTLDEISNRGSLLIGYTESLGYYSGYRVRKLELDGKLDFLYSPPDHDFPEGIDIDSLRTYPPEKYVMQATEHRHTQPGEMKPNPAILEEIISGVGAQVSDVVYVGDSEVKDIFMAQQVGVSDVHAAYGVSHKKEEYELLRDVTHWTPEMVEREKHHSEKVQATYAINAYSELLNLFEFVPFEGVRD